MSETQAEGRPTLGDQIAAIDALVVAAEIIAHGSRAAIGASTVEIMAMARHLTRLSDLADLAFDMLATADLIQAQSDPDTRRALQRAVRQKIDVIGVALETLGYGKELQQEENNDVEK